MLTLLAPTALWPQDAAPPWADSMVVTAPGARYARSGWSRVLLGARYRELWATPIRVPVLNLQRFAGGLTVTRAHAGNQTRSLRFEGRDGRTYQFRSVDKDPTARLSEALRHSVAGQLLQDGVSSSLPAAALVASALLEATGVLHVTQQLTVMPDDAALGPHRAAFAGMLGMIEERPDETDDSTASFGGGGRVISPTRLFERLDRRATDRVDTRAFLLARLVDMYMGDRDRHRDQFRWLAADSGGVTYWRPISRDHDEAFVKIDGAALAIIRIYFEPLITFGEHYPAHDKLNWHSREIDRRFLVGLERPVWDSVARALQSTLNDDVIDAAVQRMPPEMVGVGGAGLARVLKVRRDRLRDEALDYYAFLAREVELRGTDAADVAVVSATGPREFEVLLRVRGDNSAPFLRRRFDARETREVRLAMWGGKDSVIVRGMPADGPLLRIVGGAGADVVLDSAAHGRLVLYDADASTRVEAVDDELTVDARAYPEWVGSDLDRYPPRDWGQWWRPLPIVSGNSDLGLVVGAGVLRTGYGFRQQPYASHVRASVSYSTAVAALRGELAAEFRRENSGTHLRLRALASGLEILRYFGAGNDTRDSMGRDFHTVQQQTVGVEPRVVFAMGRSARWSVGPVVHWSRTRESSSDFLAGIADTLYGAGAFGTVGVGMGFETDTRDVAANPTTGTHLLADVRMYPGWWDARRAYGVGQVEASVNRSLQAPTSPTLALRIGGQRNWGPFPFQESAFIGGGTTVRGLLQQRYAGDASAFGSAEMRLTGGDATIILPLRWGGYAGADAGRVWVDGESPGGWHESVAAGVWIAVVERENTVRAGFASSRERVTFQTGVGFSF